LPNICIILNTIVTDEQEKNTRLNAIIKLNNIIALISRIFQLITSLNFLK